MIPWVGLRSVIVALSGHISIFLVFHMFHTGAFARHVICDFDIYLSYSPASLVDFFWFAVLCSSQQL